MSLPDHHTTVPGDRPPTPYGSWPSPISVDLVVAGARSLREVWLDGDDIYWIESRPDEGGRLVVVRHRPDGSAIDVTPPGSNARTMVHEYGGGSYVVDDGVLVVSDMADGRLYRQSEGGERQALTPEAPIRYADLRIDRGRQRVICVAEEHRGDGEPENTIVAVPLTGGEPTALCRGADFYSHPRIDPSGEQLAWLTWSHPDMPWDSSELWIGRIEADGSISGARRIAGGPDESIAQPEWAADGSIVFCSDRTGWSNLYRWTGAGASDPTGSGVLQPLAPMEAEFADPQWVFGQSSYGIAGDGTIVAAARSEGRDRLYTLGLDGRGPHEVEQPFAEVASVRVRAATAVFLGAGPTLHSSVAVLDLATGQTSIAHRVPGLAVDEAFMSQPRAISFTSAGGRVAHAIHYPPTNPSVRPPAGERPPLIVISHGGPTSSASLAKDMDKQFFTSRGFAMVDVDYGGSTGYGRAYRQLLDGRWGIVDVEDCTSAARYLADQGLADPERLFIRGGSAGGYTTLRAVTTGTGFAAGSSHYGVGDLEALARDTHKFESRYLDRLVGRYPAAVETYRERSPIHATDRIECPLIVFQGLDDRVVPPEQAEQLVAALERKGLPHAYLTFAGEGHGFRRAENICRVLEAELSFFAQLFGFRPADPIDPVPISGLERWRSRVADRR